MPLRTLSLLFLAAGAKSVTTPATLSELESLRDEVFFAFQITLGDLEEGICYKIIVGKAVLAVSYGAPRVTPALADRLSPGANAAAKAASGISTCGQQCCSPTGMGKDRADGFDYFAGWDLQGAIDNPTNSPDAAYAGTYLWNNYFSDQGASFVDQTGDLTPPNGPGPWLIAHLDQFTPPGHTYTSICAEDANPLATSVHRNAQFCGTEADLPVNWGAGEWDHWPCPLVDLVDPTSANTLNDGSECEQESCYATQNLLGKYPTEKLGCYKCGERHGRVGYVYLQYSDDAAVYNSNLGPGGLAAVAYHTVQRWEAMEYDDNGARRQPHGNPFQSCSYQFMITLPMKKSPPSLPPSAPAPTVMASAPKDPHLRLAHGGFADLRGEDGAVFNFLSARNVSLNVKTEAADFKWAHRVVHGTRLSAVYWTLRTDSNHVLEVEYDAAMAYRATVRNLNDSAISTLKVSTHESTTYRLDNVFIKLANHMLTVTVQDRWRMLVKQSAFPFAKLNQKKTLLDISVHALYDADHDVVAPHGLYGQSYDGDDLAVDGKVDDRSGDVTTTEAQAEGAIEGVYTDYKIDPTNPFSTTFKYSRFDSIAAKPRDVTKLTGTKRPRMTPRLAPDSHVVEVKPVVPVPAPGPVPLPRPVPLPVDAK